MVVMHLVYYKVAGTQIRTLIRYKKLPSMTADLRDADRFTGYPINCPTPALVSRYLFLKING